MAGIDLTIAQAQLDAALNRLSNAELKSSQHNARSSENYDLRQLQEQVDKWDRMVKRLSRGSGVSAQRAVVSDG